MWASIAKLWVSVSLVLDTVTSATQTVNNLVTVAEKHSENFKEISMIELAEKKTKAERQSAANLAQ